MQITTPLLLALSKFFSGAEVRWLGCQPDTCQRVYFANHTSHLDAPLLWASLPRHVRKVTRPVAAKDYWDKNFLRRHLAASFNALLIDRTRKNIKVHQTPVQEMARLMGDRYSLIIFPEGGRNQGEGDEIGEFKSGLYYLAKRRPDLELVPVYLENLGRVLPRGEYFPVPLLSCISIGPPMWLETDEPKKDFLGRARQAVADLRYQERPSNAPGWI